MGDLIGSFLKKLSEKNVVVPKVYSKNTLTNTTKTRLLSYQIPHVIKLINILFKHNICLDASDTGIGKTFISAAVCAEMEKRPIIICPKILIPGWVNVLKYFGVKSYDIVNFETIKNGKIYRNKKCKSRIESWYLDVVEEDPEDKLKSIYEWADDIPDDAILIIDEAHRCKHTTTDNGKLLASTMQLIKKKIPVMLLSATISEKIKDMKIPFYLFNLIPNMRNYNEYIKSLRTRYPKYRVKKSDYKTETELQTARENAQAMIIYEEIKEYTSRIRIKDLGDKFPQNQWFAQEFYLDDYEEVARAYERYGEAMENLDNYQSGNHLVERQKLLQKLELKKIPIFVENAKLFVESGNSVIIFVNYIETLEILCEQLDTDCVINGKVDDEYRQQCIDDFQSNKKHIIICQMRAGGVGISLHDIHGKEKGGRPRVCLLNYSDSASDMLQALGRAPRSGAKSPIRQIIIFVANVPEEKKIMNNFNKKLGNMSAINDGDLDGFKCKLKRKQKARKVGVQ